MTQIDHAAALEIAEKMARTPVFAFGAKAALTLSHAYLDLYKQSGQWDEQHAQQHAVNTRQAAELADLHDTLKSWQLGFEQDAKWSEMQAELADLRLIAVAAEVCVRKGGMMNAQRLADALTKWRTRTEKT